MNDFETKKYVVKRICELVEETQGYDPGYYVDDHHGEPWIFDKNDNPRGTVACDSPLAVIVDLGKIIRDDF